jgi:hypothetical protein
MIRHCVSDDAFAPIAVIRPHWHIGSARPIAVFRTLLGIPPFMTQSDFRASVKCLGT